MFWKSRYMLPRFVFFLLKFHFIIIEQILVIVQMSTIVYEVKFIKDHATYHLF